MTVRLASYLWLSVVALAPLPFGSNDLAVIAVWCGALGVAAVLATPAIGRTEAGLTVAIVAVAAIVGWIVVHLRSRHGLRSLRDEPTASKCGHAITPKGYTEGVAGGLTATLRRRLVVSPEHAIIETSLPLPTKAGGPNTIGNPP
jgi:hypothetical protein